MAFNDEEQATGVKSARTGADLSHLRTPSSLPYTSILPHVAAHGTSSSHSQRQPYPSNYPVQTQLRSEFW